MKINQIITQDGYISDIQGEVDAKGVLPAQFSFTDVSDYIRGAIKEKKPFLFSGRSGNAQLGMHHIANNTVLWEIVILAVPGAMCGAWIARHFAQAIKLRTLKLLTAAWITLSSIWLILA